MGRNRGISILEVLLVVSIIAVVASMSFVALNGFGMLTGLSSSVKQVRADLTEARTRARNGEERSRFGIVFATTTYEMVKVSPSFATTSVKKEMLPSQFRFAESQTVLFDVISGKTQQATITVSGISGTSTIIVDSSGALR